MVVQYAVVDNKSEEHTLGKDKKPIRGLVGKGSKKALKFSLEIRDRSEREQGTCYVGIFQKYFQLM